MVGTEGQHSALASAKSARASSTKALATIPIQAGGPGRAAADGARVGGAGSTGMEACRLKDRAIPRRGGYAGPPGLGRSAGSSKAARAGEKPWRSVATSLSSMSFCQ